MRDIENLKGISKDIERKVFTNLERIGGVVDKGGRKLKSVDDIVNAVKKGEIMPAELGKFNWGMLKSDISSGSDASKRLARDIATNQSTIKRYQGFDKDTIIQDIMKSL